MAQSELQSLKEELLAKLASKEEVAEVKKDVSGLKEDVSGLKNDVASLNKRVSSLEQKADGHSETLGKLTSLVLDLRDNSATKKELSEKFDHIMRGQDRLAKMLERKDHEMTSQDAKTYRLESYIKEESQRNDLQDKMLQRHDSRIKKLESVAN